MNTIIEKNKITLEFNDKESYLIHGHKPDLKFDEFGIAHVFIQVRNDSKKDSKFNETCG